MVGERGLCKIPKIENFCGQICQRKYPCKWLVDSSRTHAGFSPLESEWNVMNLDGGKEGWVDKWRAYFLWNTQVYFLCETLHPFSPFFLQTCDFFLSPPCQPATKQVLSTSAAVLACVITQEENFAFVQCTHSRMCWGKQTSIACVAYLS